MPLIEEELSEFYKEKTGTGRETSPEDKNAETSNSECGEARPEPPETAPFVIPFVGHQRSFCTVPPL